MRIIRPCLDYKKTGVMWDKDCTCVECLRAVERLKRNNEISEKIAARVFNGW